ncbi:hypothetical protein [Sporosarcina sp. SAFN-010]|uniref:hypothetical protein n=1 Tax=Sporosarcina sp. SAFN-010 TaxID=3387273 RepID=UPI003F7F572E
MQGISIQDIELIADFCSRELELDDAELPAEYYYTSVPYCVIDSVFSIGVRYEGVKNVVDRFSNYFNLESRRPGIDYPNITEQLSIVDFIASLEKPGINEYAEKVFANRQRTSSVNGILKTEAVYRFSKVLQKYKVNYLQDVKVLYGNADFESEIKSIPGQKSGISLVYFYMLAGEDKWIKPDRMVVRFLEKVLKRGVRIDEAQNLLERSSELLGNQYSNITPRLLDYQIWNYARNDR